MIQLIELIVIGVCSLLLLILTISKRRQKKPAVHRSIPAFEKLQRAIGLSVEDGTRLHVSIGRAEILSSQIASAMVGLGVLRNLVERTSVSDKPPVVTAGDSALAMLAQDTLQAGYEAVGAEGLYRSTTGRLSGMGPFGYAAGVMPIIRDENVSASLLIGHSGAETALLIDAAEREATFNVFASDDISAQAISYAGAQEPVLGEDVFVAGAYLGVGASHEASLNLQDILRWLLIIGLLAGAALKFVGVILMRAFAVIVAMTAGLVTLAGYFLPLQVPLLGLILNWALILAGTATLLGVFNLISIHGYKITRREKGMGYSALLLISVFATFVFGLYSGPTGTTLTFLFNAIILPAQAALMAVLAITLLYSAIRLLRYRPSVMSVLFLVTAILILLGYATLPFGDIPLLSTWIRPWATQVLALGGARGLLLGVALGTLATGLRVLFAVDRPYGGGN